MAKDKVPQSVAAVVASFEEAAGYEGLQLKRRQGAYGAIVGLGLLGLGLLPIFVPGFYGTKFLFALGFLVVLGTFTVWAKRSPAWERVFWHPEMPRERLMRHPLYWITVLTMYPAMFAARWAQEDGAGPTAILALALAGVALLTGNLVFLSWVQRDRAQLGASLASGLLLIPIAAGAIPAIDAVWSWLTVVGGSCLLIALVRLLSPRRWLVRD
jgi:hypothetical protein